MRFAAGSFDTHAVLGGFGPRQLGFAESGNFTTSAMCVGGFVLVCIEADFAYRRPRAVPGGILLLYQVGT